MGSLTSRICVLVLVLTVIGLFTLPNASPLAFIVSVIGVFIISRKASERLIAWMAISPIASHFNFKLIDKMPDIKFDTLVVLSILFYLATGRNSKEKINPKPNNSLEVAMILFFVASLLSIVFSYGYRNSIRILFDSFVVPVAVYMLAKNLLVDKENIIKIVKVCVILGILFSFLGIYEHFSQIDLLPTGEIGRRAGLRSFEGIVRVNGPFGDPEILGVVLCIILFLNTLAGKAVKLKGSLNLTARASSCLSLITLYFTMFRGIWLAYLVALGFTLVRRKNFSLWIMISILSLAFVVISMSIRLDLLFPSDLYKNKISREDTFYSRVATWKLALSIFWESPILGVGINNFQDKSEVAREYFRGVPSVESPHNSFLGVLAERGVVGFFLFCAIFYKMFNILFKYYRSSNNSFDKELALAGIGSIVAFSVASLTLTLVNEPGFINKFFFLIMGVVIGRYFRQVERWKRKLIS